ncbi:MAG TPA: GGDEF domain-containing protein [Baekduia sp.]|uniref:GGDEF domain-containing protein n=1 Tax=Baekduia sp. TaxID=2600305 RepID=UPI002B96DC04|nr:GGDEF domain-containing protein [Baekduia sp.]HMJ35295.1 GGDEF domain-containing protein [Baekduia sp.]
MSLRNPIVGAVSRTLLAAAGTVAAVGFSAWPSATACFAALAALALVQGRASERAGHEYRRESRHDALTGVGNYRELHERLHAATAADPQRFALLTLDVDRFKEINETHGHPEGDRLLQEVGRVLVENVRGTDVVARQGGDEFSVLLPESDEEGAVMLARRIEAALTSIEAADRVPVRASIGVAVFPQDGATPADLLEKADLDLRATKERRRAAALLSEDGTVAAWATAATSRV